MKRFVAIAAAVLVTASLFCISAVAAAGATVPPGEKEIIFVLDASGSMAQNDPRRLAGDSVKQMAYSLPSDYSIGFVAYNNGVAASAPPARSREWNELETLVDAVPYAGYTDAGAGLAEALALFSVDTQKTIILISDGEIVMQNDAKTAESAAQFENAVQTAKSEGISIYTIALGEELDDPESGIFTASKETNGTIYSAPTADALQSTVREILFTQLGVKKSSVGVAQTAAGENSLSVSIPAAGAAKARILITADSALSNVAANYNAAGGNIVTGSRFAVVEIVRPERQAVAVSFRVASGGTARAELIAEYAGTLHAETAYIDETDKKGNITGRTAEMMFSLRDSQTGEALLDDSYFTGKNVQLSLNGEAETADIRNGAITMRRAITETQVLPVVLTLPALDVNLVAAAETTVSLEAPPPLPPPGLSTGETVAIVTGLLAVLAAISVAVARHKKQNSYKASIDYSYGFTGKLDVCVVWARGGEYEFPPFTFPLGQLTKEKRINLAQVLLAGNVKLEFPGAEKIWFLVGPEKSILVKNGARAEVMSAGSTVTQGGQVQLAYGQKIYVSFERDRDEIEIYYRNVKETMGGSVEHSREIKMRA